MIRILPFVILTCSLCPDASAQCDVGPFYPEGAVALLGDFSDGRLSLMTYNTEVVLLEGSSGEWTTADMFEPTVAGLGFFFTSPVGLYRDSTFVAGLGESGAGFEGRVDVRDPFGSITTLTPSDAEWNDVFGAGLALHDDMIVVGASMAVYDIGACGPGKGYVFERSSGGWTEVAQFAPHGFNNVVTFYGYKIDTDGETIVFGAPTDDEAASQSGSYGAGAAYVYEKGPSGWQESAKLVASDPAVATGFGTDIAVIGDQVLVGSNGRGPGAVYVFERGPAGWVETQIITASNGQAGDRFGESLDVDGDLAVVGAPGVDAALGEAGAIYVLARDASGFWTESAEIVSQPTYAGERCGAGVAIEGNQIFWVCNGTGALRFTSLGIADASNYCISSPNSTGVAATISAEGCDSVIANGFELQAVDVPPGNAGLFLFGPNRAQYPLGNGTMCIGAGRRRLGVTSADSAGVMRDALDFGSPRLQQIQAGTTWNFQAYFRDPSIGAGFDLSDGLTVRIQL